MDRDPRRARERAQPADPERLGYADEATLPRTHPNARTSRATGVVYSMSRGVGASGPTLRCSTPAVARDYSSAASSSSIVSAGSVSIFVEPRAPSATLTRAIVWMSGASTTFTKSHSPSVGPLVEDLGAELLDVLVHLAEPVGVRLERLDALRAQPGKKDEGRHGRTLTRDQLA